MPFFSVRNLCPNCARTTNPDADGCEHCGHAVEGGATKKGPPAGVRRHRGGKILAFAVLSWVLFPVACFALTITNYMLSIGIREAIPWLLCGVLALVCGQVLAVLAVVFCFRDWFGMKAARVERKGQATTLNGGVIAGLSLPLHWWAVGAVVVSLF